jgi:RNA polymerase sigma-70 factor (ECF subfamily)
MYDPDKGQWFETKILPHRAKLRYRLRRVLPSNADLDDIIDETLARAFQIDNWREIDHGLAFISRIAFNLIIDQQRRQAVISFDLYADLDELQRSVDPEANLLARDLLRRVEKTIDSLPSRMREIFILKRVQGFSLKEIADRMDLSVSSIEKSLTQAITSITCLMDQDEEEPIGRRASQSRSAGSHSPSSSAMGREM